MQSSIASSSLLATAAAAVAAVLSPPAWPAEPVVVTGSAVVSVVEVPRPWYAPRFFVVSKMRDTIPQYTKLPGLDFKIFTLTADGRRYGGLYLWADRAAADTWFDAAWFARVARERGAAGEVRTFDAPVILDNLAGSPLPDSGVATLVTIPVPAGVTRERLVGEFQAAVPTYRKVDGLLRKYFIVTADGRFGGIYLWRTQADADRWFDVAWRERVRRTYGTDAALEWFDAPILLPTAGASAARS